MENVYKWVEYWASSPIRSPTFWADRVHGPAWPHAPLTAHCNPTFSFLASSARQFHTVYTRTSNSLVSQVLSVMLDLLISDFLWFLKACILMSIDGLADFSTFFSSFYWFFSSLFFTFWLSPSRVSVPLYSPPQPLPVLSTSLVDTRLVIISPALFLLNFRANCWSMCLVIWFLCSW